MFELVLRAPEALVEPVSDLLMDELAALSVSVEDADAGSAGEPAGNADCLQHLQRQDR